MTTSTHLPPIGYYGRYNIDRDRELFDIDPITVLLTNCKCATVEQRNGGAAPFLFGVLGEGGGGTRGPGGPGGPRDHKDTINFMGSNVCLIPFGHSGMRAEPSIFLPVKYFYFFCKWSGDMFTTDYRYCGIHLAYTRQSVLDHSPID